MIYLYLKVIHIVAVISWMVGLLYLPRLFVYHSDSHQDSMMYEIFIIMERRLMRIIMLPSMLITFISGLYMLHINYEMIYEYYFQLKILFLVMLFAFHGYVSKIRKNFERKENLKSAGFYRKINEIPTVLMILIIFLVVVKPNIM